MTPEQRFDRIETIIEKQSLQIDKHNAAIRDLIVVSRTVLTSVGELREAQAATDEKLNILIDTVDRIIRHRNPE